MVHGFRGSPLGLQDISKELIDANYTVFTPAIPPFGGAGPLSEYTTDQYANYLANYISDQNLQRPILIGHSMGSIIAAATAYHFPELIHQKLILLSPISDKTAKPLASISPLSAIIPRSAVDYVTTRFLFVPRDRELLRHTLHLTHACSNDNPPKRSDIAAAARFAAHYSIADFTLSQDILMLAGERDRIVNKRKTTQLAHDLDAELAFIPNAGHLHNYEKPHETVQKIIEFLER